MIEKVLRTTFALLFTVLGVVLAGQLIPLLESAAEDTFWVHSFLGISVISLLITLGGALLGLGVGLLAAPFLQRRLFLFASWGENMLAGISFSDLLLGVAGLLIGLLIAGLLGVAFANVPLIGPYVGIVLSIVIGYTCMHLAVSQKQQLATIYNNLRAAGKEKEHIEDNSQYGKLLDTSVIIDGRIADIARTGFLEGPLTVPVFVLEELQHIADSADVLKRNRGRRGLDILNEMQKKKIISINIVTEDFEEMTEVDSKLIKLALLHHVPVVTNDYNLNKVAELQGVTVLNMNALANAVKPVVIPGEMMYVQVIKAGKEEGQGVAYLDDGTMIVVDHGYLHLGEEIGVIVTSVLQTSAGKMIFARVEDNQ